MTNLPNLQGLKVLITGGAGFIGSNLAIKCLDLGAEVTILDNFMPDTGSNLANLKEINEKITLITGDIRNEEDVEKAVKDKDIIFNLAGQVSHILSMEDPFLDIDINCKGHIILLEACRKLNPKVKIVYTGTRTQTGQVTTPTINEENQDNPLDIYGAGSLASELYHLIYHKVHGLKTTSLRLTNIYGPRAQIKNPKYGAVNFFIGKAVFNQEINIFEPGTQKRDILFVDDVVSALILAAIKKESEGQVFVLGSGIGIPLIDIAHEIVRVAKNGSVKLVPFPPERKSIEVGDVVLDCKKIRNLLGWQPNTSISEGLQKSIDFYNLNKNDYL